MIILEAQNVTHQFPDGNVAIQEVNIAFREGEFVILAGSNGSGKTVFARHLNGLLLPTKGRVLLYGEPITKNLMTARRQIGLIFQDPDSQIVGETVAEDVAFGPENLKMKPAEVEKVVEDALKAVELSDFTRKRPQLLSGGQKRKLVVAGILAMKPRIIVFDEPFTGLDYPGVIQVLQQMLLLHENGHTLIVITHELEKVLAHADRLVVMDKGRVVLDGTPDAMINQVARYGIRVPYGEDRGVDTMTWLS